MLPSVFVTQHNRPPFFLCSHSSLLALLVWLCVLRLSHNVKCTQTSQAKAPRKSAYKNRLHTHTYTRTHMCNIAASASSRSLLLLLLLFHFMHDQFLLCGENFLVNRFAHAFVRSCVWNKDWLRCFCRLARFISRAIWVAGLLALETVQHLCHICM